MQGWILNQYKLISTFNRLRGIPIDNQDKVNTKNDVYLVKGNPFDAKLNWHLVPTGVWANGQQKLHSVAFYAKIELKMFQKSYCKSIELDMKIVIFHFLKLSSTLKT